MDKGEIRSVINGVAVNVSYRYTLGEKTKDTFNKLLVTGGKQNEKTQNEIKSA